MGQQGLMMREVQLLLKGSGARSGCVCAIGAIGGVVLFALSSVLVIVTSFGAMPNHGNVSISQYHKKHITLVQLLTMLWILVNHQHIAVCSGSSP